MQLSHDVTLPVDAEAVFPDRCVYCGREHPESTVRMSRHLGRLRQLAMPWSRGVKAGGAVPACTGCDSIVQREWTRNRWIERFFNVPVAIAIGIIVIALNISHAKWVAVAIFLLTVLPFVIWRILHPLPFDLTIRRSGVAFEFQNEQFAREFADLNGAKVE